MPGKGNTQTQRLNDNRRSMICPPVNFFAVNYVIVDLLAQQLL